MKPCISEATTLPSSFAEDVTAYAGSGCFAMEVWLTKLETHLKSHSPADTRKLLEERGIALAAAGIAKILFFLFLVLFLLTLVGGLVRRV